MSNAQTFNFDSVGDTLPVLREHEKAAADRVEVKFGPALPLRLSVKKDEMFVMNTEFKKQAADNLISMLLTNRGERVMQPDFGANLKPILSEFGSPGFESEVMARIKSSTKRFLPFISLSEMRLEELPEPAGTGLRLIQVSISYTIPRAGIGAQSVSVTLSTVG